ncbi:DUF6443 domain-containing protein, partial [Flavobacterium silvaticum]
MKKSFLLLFGLFPILISAQVENYILTRTYFEETDTTDVSKAHETITYFDGLGRPVETIQNKMSGNGLNIVTPIKYDDFGRQLLEYLPYESSATNLDFIDPLTAISELQAFYSTFREGTTNPYSQTRFEDSPLNRVLEKAAPGNAWAMANEKTIKFDYMANSEGEDQVILFTVSPQAFVDGAYTISLNMAGYYGDGELYKTVTKDENWTSSSGHARTTEEFKDKEGRIILKRSYNGNDPYDTYYVYDSYGNLTYVIPPAANAEELSTEEMENLCYQYRYDHRNRLVEKKLPGKDWEYLVYDKLDRPILTGPALNPFGNGERGWLLTKYETFGRVAYTAWINENEGVFDSAVRNDYQSVTKAQEWEETTYSNPITIDGVTVGYSNDYFVTANLVLLTVNYYDNYDYPGAIDDGADDSRTKGLATGNWVRVLNGSTLMAETSQTLYDEKGRVIQQMKTNHLGGHFTMEYNLDFNGKILNTTTLFQKDPATHDYKINDDFSFDAQERPLGHIQEIDSGSQEPISYNYYDELGTLERKEIGSDGSDFLQSVDYQYNIRGWLKKINEPCALNKPGMPTDLFAFAINYETIGISNANLVRPLYNGNISETYWVSNSDNVVRKYGYRYDSLNRMLNAYYQKPQCPNGSQLPSNSTYYGYYDESLLYDKNGNIAELWRNGDSDVTPSIQIDHLKYFYEDQSNRLLKVTDETNDPSGFVDDSDGTDDTDDDYQYDSFGNMTKDENKQIKGITYNHLNLPVKIPIKQGTQNWTISYLYNALGQKVQKTVANVTQVGQTERTLYLDGFQYVDDVLQFFPHPEGYVR